MYTPYTITPRPTHGAAASQSVNRVVPSLLSRVAPSVAWFCLAASTVHGQDAVKNTEDGNAVSLEERNPAADGVRDLNSQWSRFGKPATSGARQLLGVSGANDKAEEGPTAPRKLSLARKAKTEFTNPEELFSKNGELKVVLEAGYAKNRIGEDPVYLRCFNGKLVGPTLRVKPGDKIRLTLRNTMAGERWQPNMMNTLNSFNTLNLHYHGLHVSPNGISDNVLIQVGPHETQEYVVDIPKDHTPGTYWYHPHRHGSTAGDVASSMSGTLIIEGGLDDIPEIKAAKDRVMVLNQIPYIYKNTLPDPNSTTTPPATKTFNLTAGVVEAKYAAYIFGPGQWATLGRYTTINGIQLPVIRMRPGQVERWRFVDSGQRETILLAFQPTTSKTGEVSPPPMNFQEIAVDGLALGKMIEKPEIELWPGYRSDVLVKAPMVKGEYILVDKEVSASNSISGTKKPLNYVARVIIDGEPEDMKLPTSEQMKGLRLPSIKDAEITGKQEAKYGILAVGNGVVFTIDGKSFDMETARQLQLNDVDEWTISTNNTVANGFVTHPFHIHVNPFEVTSIMAPLLDASGKPVKENGKFKLVEELKNGPEWRDTVKIPGNGYVKMRTRYTDFIGTFVQHCHILDHEDQGMMQLIDIVRKKGATASAGVPATPAIGSLAPDFALPDAQGKNHSLVEVAGKPAVVFFFKGHGCLHCAQQVAAFVEHYKAFKQKGIEVIGITSDDAATLKTALDEYPCPFTLLADPKGTAFAKFGCVTTSGLSHGTFTLDANRHVTWSTVGASPFVAVKELLSDTPPLTSTETAEIVGKKQAGVTSPVVPSQK